MNQIDMFLDYSPPFQGATYSAEFDQDRLAAQALNHLLTTSEVEEANWFAAKVEKVAERIARSPCHLGTREDAFILAREAVEEMGQ